MNRLRAFLIHLIILTALLGATFAVVYFIWYPEPYFELVGAWYLVRILLVVNIVVGPMLTLIIFKPGKWGLRFDLFAIALVQAAALIYGTSIIYQERPYFMVYAVDRFELVPLKDIDRTKIEYDVLNDKPSIGVVPVYAALPEDPQELSDFTVGVLYEGESDLERRPEFWHPYADHGSDATASAKDIQELLAEDEEIATLAQQVIERHRLKHAELGVVPLIGRTSSFSVVLDMQTGEQLEIVDIDLYQLAIDKQAQPDP